jgi:hypothetical protein
MQCACAILLSAACPALLQYFTLPNNQHDFRKKWVKDTKYVFRSSLQILSETLLVLRRTERGVMKSVYCSSREAPFTLFPILMKLQFSRQVFGKYSNIKFLENPSSRSRVVPRVQADGRADGWIDRHTRT